jgi:hypothetical protein
MSKNSHAIFAAILGRRRGFPAVDCDRWWNMGASLQTCKHMSNRGLESHIIAQDQEIQKCAFYWQSDVDTVLGLNGPILKHYQDCRQVVNSAQCCAMLEEELKPQKCWQIESFCIMTMFNLMWQQWPFKWFRNWDSIFSPTQHSPDLTSSNYHVFGLLRDALLGWHFADGKEVKDARTKNIIHRWHHEAHGLK